MGRAGREWLHEMTAPVQWQRRYDALVARTVRRNVEEGKEGRGTARSKSELSWKAARP
jgi:hypothetical protein